MSARTQTPPAPAEARTDAAQPARSRAPSASLGAAMSQRLARVQAITDDALLVDEGGRSRLVQPATSCLLEPCVGDLVLLVTADDDPGGYVLAVLERAAAAEAVISSPGGASLTLRAPAGRVRVEGSEGVELHTPGVLELRADEARLQSRSLRLFLDECAAIIRSAFASLTKLTHVGEAVELLVSRFTQHSQHSTRVIAGVDHTQAEEVDLRAGNNVHLRSERTVINGREVVKLDGGQIHLG
ncbi:DUF3540 domain-containing protein [Pseudenhygromyxa sp. WMMC2535]|uniref:DUF3540 domain-containing protein n=1 Tax=Pseudenhygromyxa sp. WMMC2535 TaxID=2712867 RepID=UPI0015528912|nr:DUF3540 domain-containing protein [Pseudenhygromyxa sp. WMMC2535]NVB36436.1 DUF3540 domain-containing protein [Pseudenhygromyxa sp. WMMC2535]